MAQLCSSKGCQVLKKPPPGSRVDILMKGDCDKGGEEEENQIMSTYLTP